MMSAKGGNMNIVKVRYHFKGSDQLSSQEYTYFAEEPLAVGEEVIVPVRDGTVEAQVTTIGVLEEEIAAFRDKVKIIPAAARLIQQTKEVKPKMHILDIEQVEKKWQSGGAWLNREEPTKPGLQEQDRNSDGLDIALQAPQNNPDVKVQAERGMALMLAAEKAVIASDEDVKSATNDLAMIAQVKKALTKQRDEYLSPLKAATAKVNEAFKLYLGPVARADELLRQKILAYRKDQDTRRAEQERINALRMEAAQAEMRLKGEVTEPVALVEEAVPPAQRYRADIGMASGMRIRKWRLIDIAQVPDEYKMVDGPKVTKLVKAGIVSIPGIEIYEEETLQVRGS